MPDWQPDQYLRFEEERTRPCRDLVSQIRLDDPRNVIDLGCGPGNSTAVLAERWPTATITGLDSSPDMLNRAQKSNPRHEWVHSDIADWATAPQPEFDVVFSNAALHWVTDHATVYPRLLALVAAGGVFAVQVPANREEFAHQAMLELALSNKWKARFPATGLREWFVHDTAFYYDVLSPLAQRLDIWETTYIHLLPSVEAIAEWYRSTSLRPFLDCLGSSEEREDFLRDYANALRPQYKARADGRVLFPFRRLFLIASRGE